MGLLVQRQEHDAVGQLVLLIFPVVLTNHKDVYNLPGYAVVRLCGGLGGRLRGGLGFLGDRVAVLGRCGLVQVANQGGEILPGGVLFFKPGLLHPANLGIQVPPCHARHQAQHNHDGQHHRQHNLPGTAAAAAPLASAVVSSLICHCVFSFEGNYNIIFSIIHEIPKNATYFMEFLPGSKEGSPLRFRIAMWGGFRYNKIRVYITLADMPPGREIPPIF